MGKKLIKFQGGRLKAYQKKRSAVRKKTRKIAKLKMKLKRKTYLRCILVHVTLPRMVL